MQLFTVGDEADHTCVPELTLLKAMLVVVLGTATPLNVTDQLVPEGRPLSVNVTVVVEGTKFAVIVPAASIVAVVEELVDEAKVIEPVLEDHDENT